MRLGLDHVEHAHNPRRAVLLLTDGFENASRVSITDLVKTRNQSETPIFGFGIGSARIADLYKDMPRVTRNGQPNAAELRRMDGRAPGSETAPAMKNNLALPAFDYLETLVGDSGGTVTRILTLPEATMAVKNLTDRLRFEYVVGYTPKKALDGKYRKIKVEVNRRGVYVHHRGGYLALPAQEH